MVLPSPILQILSSFAVNFEQICLMMIIIFVVWLTDERHLALFPAGTIVRDPHHRESPTPRA